MVLGGLCLSVEHAYILRDDVMNKIGAALHNRLSGFHYQIIEHNGVKINVATIGVGSPIVLLHGFPEMHLTWRFIAPELAKNHSVVCLDLRGYGESGKPKADSQHANYSKRTMARDVLHVMAALGHTTFSVVGHDRGAMVAYRLALDHPGAVKKVVILDIIPGIELWNVLSGVFGLFSYHMFFLAQNADFPERMISASPKIFFDNTLNSWCKTPDAIPEDVRAVYLEAFSRPEAIMAMCEDYRAGASIDIAHDAADQKAQKKIQAPTLVLWQDPGAFALPFDPLKVWKHWAKAVEGKAIVAGHFLQEEKPDEILANIRDFVA